ncbi:GAF domain-containing protein [Saccharopolyspora sp. NPDC049426]|uniref:helix-turn-helix domain-containing protein n=1 Tax=Saccharopolyspora sp. NPDC049426 TaxID=3155652 RepID=UPI0034489E68
MTGANSPQDDKGVPALLELLDKGIAPLELENVLASHRTGTEDPRAAAALRRVNNSLWEARRREALLRTLHETATDLTAIRDVEAILSAIVRRTRSLMGTDMAYISLNDDSRRQTYIRMADGVTTAAYRAIRMPLGAGVLGKVARGASPAQTEDYLTDETFIHIPEIDDAVAGEGVKAIMGVPLRASGTLIGALLVANRHRHTFSNDDVAFVESIGAHAAVALENARAFSEMGEALSALDEARSRNLEHLQALQGLVRLDEVLTAALLESKSVEKIVPLLAEFLRSDVAVVDAAGTLITSSRDGLIVDDITGIQQAAARSANSRGAVELSVAGQPWTLVAATAGSECLGALLVAEPMPPSTALVERSAVYLSILLLFEQVVLDAEEHQQRELIDDMLAERSDHGPALRRRVSQYRLTPDGPWCVHIVDVAVEQRYRALVVLRTYLHERSGLVSLHEGHLCLVTPGEVALLDGQGALKALKAADVTATIGCSGPVNGLAGVRRGHRYAQAIVNALEVLGREGEAADLTHLGTAGILLGLSDRRLAQDFVEFQLGPILDYDRHRNTDLTFTAWTFLDTGSVLAPTAQRLKVHLNTVRQRLERIDQLLGTDWRRGSRMLDSHVALRMWRLRTAGTGEGLVQAQTEDPNPTGPFGDQIEDA